MQELKRVQDLPYFSSEEQAEEILKIFARPERPIMLPVFEDIMSAVNALNEIASSRKVTAADLLPIYQRLRESHSNTDIFCGWKIGAGSVVCGAMVDIEVNALGAYYQCKADKSHRTPKP